jgi:hypothetical protein
MARTKIVLFKSNIRRDGSCPVCLRVAKEDKTKYIDLQLSATKGQWDELASRFNAYSGGYPFSISGDIRSVPS